jgi:homocysteine S-methyltransferase
MGDLISELKAGPLLADGGIGSYIFELTGRLSEGGFVYEGLNTANPGLIKGVHLAYLQAGARALTTNTFSANRVSLEAGGLAGQTAELNRAGVHLAKDAIDEFKAQNRTEGQFFVLGSAGPLPTGRLDPGEAKEVYREQVQALAGAGADAVLFETFQSFESARPALEGAHAVRDCPPVVLHVTVRQGAEGWSEDPAQLVRDAAYLGVRVIGVNCCAPWEASGFVEAARAAPEVRNGEVVLSAMPNAGGFERIGHRYLSRVTPEFMGKLARTLSEKDVRLIGGCCEVHPQHIAEMRNYLQPAHASGASAAILAAHGRTPAGPAEKRGNGRFSRKLFDGEFVVSVEVLPPRGTGPKVIEEKVGFVRQLAASGLADAVDFTDGSRGIPLMPPGDFAGLVRERLGWTAETGDRLEVIPHFTTRDLNTMALQSRLMGYFARRINNVLFITGDPPKMSPTYPRSTAVFDMDSVAMVRYTHSFFNAGLDFGGQPLGRHADPRTRFTIGAGAEPEALNREREMEKLRRKIEAGVDYVFTQPVFQLGALEAIEWARKRVPVCIGVMVLGGVEHAKRLAQVPGVVVPGSVFDRLGRYPDPDDQAKAGIELAVEQARWAQSGGWSGLYVVSPGGHGPVIEVLRGALS